MLARVIIVLASVVLLAGFATAQDVTAIHGKWIGTSEDDRGKVLVIEKDVIVLGGTRIPYTTHGPRTIVLGGEDGERAEWSLAGDVLTFTIEGEASTWRRDGKAPAQPQPTPRGGNPLAGKRPVERDADPFARTFSGDSITRTLRAGERATYTGTLSVDGAEYRTEATSKDKALRGRFQVDGEWYDFTATLDGDRLKLASDGATHELVADKTDRPGAEKNPGGTTPGETHPESGDAPPALEGVFDGETTRFEHPRGWFACELPKGWTVYSQDDTGLIVNPGLTQSDTLDAIVFMLWGRLEAADQNQPVAKVVEKYLPKMREVLAQQGLQIGEGETPIATCKSKEVPGAVVTLNGRTQQGQTLQVWYGSVVKQDGWLGAGAVVMEGKAEAYLPKVKRIFTTLEPKPPERNAKLEAALVGRTFSSSQYGRVTGSGHHASYSFEAGGAVTRRLMSNVPSQPGLPGASTDSERGGRYEVCGDVLYLYFETGQESAQVVQQGGKVTAIRIGNAVYE
ncbi:MAG: hypothetical protein HZB39_00265 [Planctomycetes bacterium]|nr:hypothetical protein [Planctomycetota bacterium]